MYFNKGVKVCCRLHKDESVDNLKNRCFNQSKRVIPQVTPTINNNTKRMFCRSVLDNTPCTYGDKCNFAHTQEEITPQSCGYGDTCVHIVTGQTGAFNRDRGKICQRIHPCENINTYCIRILGK